MKLMIPAIILLSFMFTGIGCVQRGNSGTPVEPGVTKPEPQILVIAAALDQNFMTPEQTEVVQTVFNYGDSLDDVKLDLEISANPDGSWQARGAVTGMQVTIDLNLRGYYNEQQLQNGEIIFFGDLFDNTGKGTYVYCIPDLEEVLVTLTMPHGESLILMPFGKSFPQIEEVMDYAVNF